MSERINNLEAHVATFLPNTASVTPSEHFGPIERKKVELEARMEALKFSTLDAECNESPGNMQVSIFEEISLMKGGLASCLLYMGYLGVPSKPVLVTSGELDRLFRRS